MLVVLLVGFCVCVFVWVSVTHVVNVVVPSMIVYVFVEVSQSHPGLTPAGGAVGIIAGMVTVTVVAGVDGQVAGTVW